MMRTNVKTSGLDVERIDDVEEERVEWDRWIWMW